ncbi:hypothetical protein [Xanthobacter sp. VNH20]|uniref:hypothetical protein n=1 Tax=Xanthobacter sp. VNH20 TaxID=3156616 RepID=UPI0032B4AEA4
MTDADFLCQVAAKCALNGVPPHMLSVVGMDNGTAIRISLPDGTFNLFAFRTSEKPLHDFVDVAAFRVSKEWKKSAARSDMRLIDSLSPEARALVHEYGSAAAVAALHTFDTTAKAAEFLAEKRSQAQEFKLHS